MNKKNAVAAAVFAAVVLCIVVMYHAGARLGAGMQGPSKIARAPDGTVWVASDGKLHQFSADGERKQVIPLRDLGLGTFPSELLPLADGTLVLAEAEPSAAYRCDVAAKRCTPFTAEIAKSVGPTKHALMIAADESAQRFYISDNAKHRLILLDFDGKVLDVTAPRRLIYPNEIHVEKPGEIVVVDTNHHRLVRIDVAGDRFGADLWEMKTNVGSLHRAGRIWPMDFAAAANGGWWVLDARDGMKDADLLLFGADGNELKRIDLGPGSDPTQIATIDGGLLVADPTQATLTRIGEDGENAVAWGGATFSAELSELKASRSMWRNLRLAAQVLVVVFPLIGVLLLWRMGERLPERSIKFVEGTAPAPITGGVHWLELNPEFVRRARRMQLTSVLLLLVMVVVFPLVFDVSALLRSSSGQLRVAFVALIGMVLVMILAQVALFVRKPRAWRLRIGSDGKRFFLDPGNGRTEEYPFTELATSGGRVLLAGKRFIALYTGLGPLFAPEEIRDYILARIPASGHVSQLQLSLRGLERGSRQMWAIVVILAVGIVLAVLPLLFPSIGPFLKTLIAGAAKSAAAAK